MERTNGETMRLDIQILKILFPSVLFQTHHDIHLTFDDGPHPLATPLVLHELKKYNIKATFFLVGQNAKNYPDLVQQIHTEGHQIANHSFTHSNLLFRKRAFVYDEINKTKNTLDEIIGKHSHYFRPPYGYFDFTTLNVLRELNLLCVLWNIDSLDYSLHSETDIARRIVQKTSNGTILLCHDNNLTSQKVEKFLPAFLDTMLTKGFKFKTLPA
jgi:peptidoglycan-N-acetylglucosamine deacetylase